MVYPARGRGAGEREPLVPGVGYRQATTEGDLLEDTVKVKRRWTCVGTGPRRVIAYDILFLGGSLHSLFLSFFSDCQTDFKKVPLQSFCFLPHNKSGTKCSTTNVLSGH